VGGGHALQQNDFGGDAGGIGHDQAGGDAGGQDHDGGGGEDQGVHFFSVQAVLFFLSGFSIGGYFAAVAFLDRLVILATATGAGGLLAWLGYQIMGFLYRQQGTSVVSADMYVGTEGLVDTSIPASGVGVISCRELGSLETFMAQSADGRAIPVGMRVRILEVAGTTAVVEAIPLISSETSR
jgi:membrane protein implicated in regulation of membrane protease activity